jgi:hypothetical protein
LTGEFLPTAPGHVREEQELINTYWSSRNYADSLKLGNGKWEIQPFTSKEQIEEFQELVGAWLRDSTGDEARGRFLANHPQALAYLTPKTFYAKEGIPPEITSYEEYQKEVEAGDRVVAPLHIMMMRAQSSFIQANDYNKFIAKYGNDPMQAAAAALRDRQGFNELRAEKDIAYQALYMQDDMHGGLYDAWQKERFQDDNWALEQVTDKLNTVRDNLGLLLELDESLDVELDLDGIKGLNTSVKAAIAEISNAIRDYNELSEDTSFRNPYETAIHRWYSEVYLPYQEGLTQLYDLLEERPDTERQSLVYEQIKLYRNEFANADTYLDGDTTIPFPSPLDYSWAGRSEEEKDIKRQQWLTRPIEWIDQDSALHIIEGMPMMAHFLPMTDADFEIYKHNAIAKVQVSEMLEFNQITPGQERKMLDALEEELRSKLIAAGRAGEVAFMDMTPYEKLTLAGVLPPELGIFAEQVRYYKEILAVRDVSALSTEGRPIVTPLFNEATSLAYADPNIMEIFRSIGENLLDKGTLDNILPWLFFGDRREF